MKAIWNDKVIAESDDTIVVENNHYFPRKSLKDQYLRPSDTTSHCPWKGEASYFTLEVEGNSKEDAVWYYKKPSKLAAGIKDRVAFSKGVVITD